MSISVSISVRGSEGVRYAGRVPPLPNTPPDDPRRPQGTGQGFFVLGIAVGLLAALAVERTVRRYLDRDIELVRAVRDLALQDFVREVDSEDLIDDALGGMLSELDRYSHYYVPKEIPALDRDTTGEFRGIGVVFRLEDPGRVLFPYPGSPADRAGLGVGDRILEIDGRRVSEIGLGAMQVMLREDRSLVLLVEDLEQNRRELELESEPILDPTVRHARILSQEEGIAYVAIRSFSHRTPGELDEALDMLGDSGMRALVLDLRWNPGGILDAAVAIANRFVPSGALVATLSRTETRVTEAQEGEAHLAGMPLVVLLDGASASASEILAAALQDHAVAVLIGEPSYGKGTVQTLKRIGRERAVVKITTAHYASPSLRRIEHEDGDDEHNGIAPDLWVPLTRTESLVVRAFLESYTPPESVIEALRQWEQREQLDLIEDPPPDRQLDSALALLGGEPLELHADPLH